MNSTYNKELSSSLKNASKEFVKEQYKLDHKKNASKVTLYYSHGQTEKNENNFKSTRQDRGASDKLDSSVVKACNLAENVHVAAKQSLVDSGSATSNVSTAAANMQIAANAINKLASDVAAMNSIAINANYESSIQSYTEKANEKIQAAAKLAESVSLDSMQATIEAAQATASTVVTNSEAAVTAVKNLQKATAANYSNLSQEAVTAKEKLTATQKVEKLASANFDVSSKQDNAITNTRRLINKASNADIKLVDSVKWDSKHKKPHFNIPYGISKGDSYSIMWNAFNNEDDIQQYRLIMVKLDDSEAFDINIAHNLSPGAYFSLKPSKAHKYHRTFYLLDADLKVLPAGDSESVMVEKVVDGDVVKEFEDFENVRKHIAVDYKGRPIERGEYYVTYIYAEYKKKKQRDLNSTVGYLSQPSKKLRLQTPLYHTETPTIHAPYFNSRNVGVSVEVPTKYYDPSMVDFRVMLIESKNVESNTINRQIREAVVAMEKAEFKYHAEQNKLNEWTTQFNEFVLEEKSLGKRLEDYDPELDPLSEKELKQKMNDVADQIKILKVKLYGKSGSDGQTKIVADAKQAYQQAEKFEAKQSAKKISDFIIDADLMALVSAADYKIATPNIWNVDSALTELVENAANGLSLWLKLFDQAKFINEKEKTRNELEKNFQDALDKLRIAQAKVDIIEGKLDEREEDESDALKDGNLLKVLIDDIEIIVSEEALAKAVQEMRLKEKFLNEAEAELKIYSALEEDHNVDLSTMVNNFVKSNFEIERAEEILLKLLNNDLLSMEKMLKEEGWAKKDGRYVPVEKKKAKASTVEEDSSTPADILPPEKIILYTEMGEDATDNYGEPLYMNQKDYIAQAVAQLKEELSKKISKDSLDKKIEEALAKLTMDQIIETFGDSAADDISYDATIYSALSLEMIQNEEEYETTHSPYSASVTLYKVAE